MSKAEALWGVGLSLLFLLLQGVVVGLTPAHIAIVVLFLVLYLSHRSTRKLAVALLPFVVFGISYDWMRLWPNYNVNPIDIRGLYEAERSLFGITDGGVTMIPGQFLSLHANAVADLLAGLFYLCWVPLPIAFGLWLYFTGRRRDYLRFAICFLVVNLVGFVGYYIHPAAPPWYVLEYGFDPVFNTPGNVAGLGRFDELIGLPVFHSIYANNSNVFAAVPSLHAAYMLVATVYAVISRKPWPAIVIFALVTMGIWWTAVYSCHHYIIDVLLGIITAIVGMLLMEQVLMRWKPFRSFFERYLRYILVMVPFLFLLGGKTSAAPSSLHAQEDTSLITHHLSLQVESQLTASTGDHTPLWLNANRYGLSSLKNVNGYLRVAAVKPVAADSVRHWSWGYGADIALAAGFTSTFIMQQAYAELRWLKGRLTVGSKEQPLELKNQQLSTGSQTLGVNARPVPAIRLSLPEYWDIPLTRHYAAIKGHLSYGLMTDDHWQKDVTATEHHYTRHTKLHTKAGYLRLGRSTSPLIVEGGLEMGCEYGGTSWVETSSGLVRIENKDGLKGAWHAFIPTGGEVGEGIYKNVGGNHVGSWLLRATLRLPAASSISVYADHYFEDHSQMFFLDYDGYGQGEQYNEWVDRRWLLYSLKDIMLGAELKLGSCRWVDNIVIEYLYTKYQSGPIYHDRTRLVSDHIGGKDNYYNHYIYTGWQHWGQVMGNPLYRSPLYNDDGTVRVANNRFYAWHGAFSGHPTARLGYRVLATWQRGWGTYDDPLLNPETNVSLMAEAQYRLPIHDKYGGRWTLRAACAMDRGHLLGNNTGLQLTLSRIGRLLPN